MPSSSLVEVVVVPPIAEHESLCYAVPSSLALRVREGCRVLVPLGTRQVTGIVVGSAPRPPPVSPRDVLDALDDTPLLSRDLLALCRFAAGYYMASLGEVLESAVVAGFRAESRRTARLLRPDATARALRLGKLERAIVECLAGGRSLQVSTLARRLRSAGIYEALRTLTTRGIVTVDDHEARAAARARHERVLVAVGEPTAEDREALARRAPSQWRLWEQVRASGTDGLPAREAGERGGGAARALVARGWLRVAEREGYRAVVGRAMADAGERRVAPVQPTTAQSAALALIGEAAAARRFQTFLLRGVTGSGKTEVYLRAATDTLERERGVLWLVPEIALTHELVAQVHARFGPQAALLHSGLSASERFDEWRRLARGEARIAVGVRSAVFAPVPDLGLVVVDEEHDGAYKQEDGLRYNARDLAIVRARDAGCPAVLGSATPSIESHWRSLEGRYQLLELGERVENRPLPTVELVDLRTERPEGDPAIFSPRLTAALAENLAMGGQSLLFLNRRGYAHYLQCTLCGHVLGCPNCSVTLTFHLGSRRARCHHCDFSRPAPELCPECTSPSLRDFGVGTEQVEAAVRALLPLARVARMDRDTMRRRGAQGRLLADWRAAKIDVLVGTQMVTKGHDIPGVTLVGVVLADQSLNLPDFRASERTFQMLTQVAGRAGRGDQPGRVLIQTYRPRHEALTCSIAHDFMAFAERELRYREALRYPPFARLANLRVDGVDAARVEKLASDLAGHLRLESSRQPRSRQAVILGPAPAPIERLRGRFRWQVLVKAREPSHLQAIVRPAVQAMDRDVRAAAARLAVDVDPYAML